MGKASRDKGKVGERLWAKQLREWGWDARRTSQYCGQSDDSSDVLSSVPGVRWEVKYGYGDVDLFSKQTREWFDKAWGETKINDRAVIAWKRPRTCWIVGFLDGGELVWREATACAIEQLAK